MSFSGTAVGQLDLFGDSGGTARFLSKKTFWTVTVCLRDEAAGICVCRVRLLFCFVLFFFFLFLICLLLFVLSVWLALECCRQCGDGGTVGGWGDEGMGGGVNGE